jgi:Transposase
MSSESTPRPIIYLGMDVHKDSITIAGRPAGAKTPTRLERLPNDLPKLKKWIARVARDGEIRACYEASGAGYVLHRALEAWGYACEVIAPSLIPKRSGVQRKHDKRDATDLARLYRAGELVAVRIPSEADERVRDIVRCRETFQREILKSRHYILKFLARRGFVFREGTNWCTPHLQWPQHLTTDGSPLAPQDRLVFREYHALLMYKRQRRDETRSPDRAARVAPHAALRAAGTTRVLPGPHLPRGLDWRSGASRLHHQGGQYSLPARAGPSRMELSASPADQRRSETAASRPAAGRDHARLEGTTAAASAVPALGLDVRALSTALCGPCRQQSRDPRA